MNGPTVDLLPFALAGSLPAQAQLLWNWSYQGNGIDANGTFLTANTPDANGDYQISAVTGSRNGEPIIALEPPGDAIPGNAGYPVDNLIAANGQLTANGFGYETADGNYANPYYANYLTPAIDQEVFTQPASGGFSELPVDFNATIVPGVTIATAIPAQPTDTLSLVVIQAPQSGSLSLHGTSVQYLPVGKKSAGTLTFSFELKDRTGVVTPLVTVIAGANGSQTVTGAASGYTDISFGDGNSTIALSGALNTVTTGNGNHSVTSKSAGGDDNIVVGNGNNTISLGGGGNTIITGDGNNTITLGGSGSAVTLGTGIDTVHGGTADTITIAGNNSLTVFGTHEMVFIGSGNARVQDRSSGIDLTVGPTAGHDILTHFSRDPGGVVDLTGGIGGYRTAAAVLSALRSDGHGGTLLPFGHGDYLDFAAVTPRQLHASNFRLG